MPNIYNCKCGHDQKGHGNHLDSSWGKGKCNQTINLDGDKCKCEVFE